MLTLYVPGINGMHDGIKKELSLLDILQIVKPAHKIFPSKIRVT